MAQEVAARALRYRARFDGERAPWPWLRRLAGRVLADLRAASARRREREVELETEPAARAEHHGGGDEELARWLTPLPAREREILVRFHAREESVATIALALGLPEGTVKSCLSRARRLLLLAELHVTREQVSEDEG